MTKGLVGADISKVVVRAASPAQPVRDVQDAQPQRFLRPRDSSGVTTMLTSLGPAVTVKVWSAKV